MDIRNIKVPERLMDIEPNLETIYQLGIEQLNKYQVIEKLPDFPLDINHSHSQVILKDFISRVTEELTEGFESTSEIVDIMDEVGWNIDIVPNYKTLLNHLQNANEEQADAIGFFISLLLYSNILPEDILAYIGNHLEKTNIEFDDILSYGVKLLFELDIDRDPNLKTYGIFNITLAEYYEIDYNIVNSYTPGFHSLSRESHDNEAFYLWHIVYQINIARNLLKNRPWKQTQVMTKELDYQEAIVKSFIMYMGFLAIMGFSSKGIMNLFIRKQQLNLWRISTGY